VENVVHDGFPDVSYTDGLIELKHVKEWPRRGGRLEIGFRPAQPPFLARRWSAGGLVWVMVCVARDWLLYDGWTAAMQLRHPQTRESMEDLAAWHHQRGDFDPRVAFERLGQWLRGNAEEMMPHDRARFIRLMARQTQSQLAACIGWPVAVIHQAEQGSERTQDLLDFWEC
jgi:hypothetical protein